MSVRSIFDSSRRSVNAHKFAQGLVADWRTRPCDPYGNPIPQHPATARDLDMAQSDWTVPHPRPIRDTDIYQPGAWS